MDIRARRSIVGGLVLAVSATLPSSARADDEVTRGWAFLGTGYSIMAPTRAAFRDPHFGMRLFWNGPAAGTLGPSNDPAVTDTAAASPSGATHTFWDVAFGESMPVVGWYDVSNDALLRYTRGVQLNFDAAAFMLLDFDSQSWGVINTDYRLGLSVDGRLPFPRWERLSLKVGFFHQSTHLGDEYVLSARTIQRQETPAVNGVLPFRANPSYWAVPITLSWDWSATPQWGVRVYGGTMLFVQNAIAASDHAEWRVGAEVQRDAVVVVNAQEPVKASPRDVENLPSQSVPPPAPGRPTPAAATVQQAQPADFSEAFEEFGFGHSPIGPPTPPQDGKQRLRRGWYTAGAKYELLMQRRFEQTGGQPGPATFVPIDGHWRTHHLMLTFQLNTRTRHSSSNALALSLEGILGRNQHGQLVAYHALKTIALSCSYYW
jgi:hypothetical protein